MLGKVERAAKRTPSPHLFLMGLSAYLKHHLDNPSGVFHPSWLTHEEKVARLKKRSLRLRKQRSKR